MSSVEAEYESYLVENWTTDTLIVHLKEQNLKLDKDDFAILKVNGLSFLELTKEDLLALPYNFPGGPAILLAKEVQALKDNTKRPFSSYKSLSEVLEKYGINSDSITSIPQFVPGNAGFFFVIKFHLVQTYLRLTYAFYL